jgi:hypothetical protein
VWKENKALKPLFRFGGTDDVDTWWRGCALSSVRKVKMTGQATKQKRRRINRNGRMVLADGECWKSAQSQLEAVHVMR